MTRLSLAQQLAQLDDTAPVDFDPEDIQHGLDPEDAEEQADGSAAREHYIEVGASSLRKLHDSISDPKYDGIRTSRKQLLQGSEDEAMSDEESEGDEDAAGPGDSGGEDDDMRSESEATSVDDEEKEDLTTKPHAGYDQENINIPTTLQKTREDDRRKGKAITRQIAVWDSLLDARIRLQKVATSSNKLPTPADMVEVIHEDDQVRTSLLGMLNEAALLSEELFQFQSALISSNTDVQIPPRKRRKVEALGTTADFDAWLKEATTDAVASESAVHPYEIQTLAKWSSKIQAVAPSALLPSNRNAFSKNRQNLKSVVQLIDETLTTDRNKLLARTQVRRSKGARLGTANTERQVPEQGEEDGETIDRELFDDNDFYQQLLRDIIDARGDNAAGADDWISIQKQKKSKKKVDTKASKGRKLRFDVHEKLQNFMVPVPVAGSWHEEQIDELFASLLGKGFEQDVHASGDDAMGDGLDSAIADTGAGKELQEQADASLRGGSFRVFG
ncbi:rRNA-processing protein bfr2 [Pleurotus ostreatus]|uniref:Protein BFR2 n=1 Tax=Pleurotus ostreatus TaxID=5322 RepID=A0A8H6ZTG6_PLEOS|nr:rRNA-processing protein bfr2 [Pleurotus ostreatus]KAF7430554.1 rRNA-processing protein bfr2 [Pleurotus ostreatus]KAJ8694840.1 rRNA-processing protein bfr2 [Pleurotus ostreatus]